MMIVRYTEPVAGCECGGWLFVEACRIRGEVMMFHCASCGYCSVQARPIWGQLVEHHPRVA